MDDYTYFDHAATTPLDPRVRDAMAPFLDGAFGNPSSLHRRGREAHDALENARAEVAVLLGARPAEIVFTGSGTEADNLAILGAIAPMEGPIHIVTSAFEHPAVLEPCRQLERRGVEVTYLPVDGDGIVRPESLTAALRPTTRLVSVMAANNVVGTVQPLAELAGLAHEAGALFHTDAVQAAGKLPLSVERLPIDLLSLSAHKLHGPKGVGALYVRGGVELEPVVRGGGQERGLRSATENVAGIVGFGRAAVLARDEMGATRPAWWATATACPTLSARRSATPTSSATRTGACPAFCASAFRARRPTPSACCSRSTTPASPCRRAAPAAPTTPASRRTCSRRWASTRSAPAVRCA